MKKPHLSVLIVITVAFVTFTLGFFLGRNHNHATVQVSVPVSMQTQPIEVTTVPEETLEPTETVTFPININTATEDEFMALPGIGEVLAQRILNYREEAGTLDSVEDLMNVEGIGEKRMEDMLDLITIGG